MICPILTPADFWEIRASLDVTLDGASLPDALIAADIHLGRATEWVVTQNPDAANYAGAVDARSRAVRRACVLATAALLAPRVPWLIQETFGVRASYKRQETDIGMLVSDLWSQAHEQIQISLPEGAATTSSGGGGKPFFTTAKARPTWPGRWL